MYFVFRMAVAFHLRFRARRYEGPRKADVDYKRNTLQQY
jgi:hypothetical protein